MTEIIKLGIEKCICDGLTILDMLFIGTMFIMLMCFIVYMFNKLKGDEK